MMGLDFVCVCVWYIFSYLSSIDGGGICEGGRFFLGRYLFSRNFTQLKIVVTDSFEQRRAQISAFFWQAYSKYIRR